MKSAENWLDDVWDSEGGADGLGIFDAHEEWVKQIQLDAWKQGMLDAANSCKHSASLLTDDTKLIAVLALNSAHEALTKAANKATSIDEITKDQSSTSQS